jgi:hypothetical protein
MQARKSFRGLKGDFSANASKAEFAAGALHRKNFRFSVVATRSIIGTTWYLAGYLIAHRSLAASRASAALLS